MRKTTKTPISVRGDLHLDSAGAGFLAGKRIELLEAIAQHGSITKAAKSIDLSYKAAWDAVDAMNNLAEKPLVVRLTGGRDGGGTQLTDYGKQLLVLYRQLQTGQQRVLKRMQSELHNAGRLNDLLKAITLKTSARNQLRGVIKRIKKGAVNADVVLDLGDGLEIFANITNESVVELGLKRGGEAMALIKSSFVLLSPDMNVRISASNCLPGTISGIVKGAINSEVKLQLPGARTLTAMVTNLSVEQLNLRQGSPCCALVNASHVLIAVND